MQKFCYDYPMPAVATDIAVFTLIGSNFSILLIQRKEPPFVGEWALPGGFLNPDEDLDGCARRELQEETGVEIALLHHFGNFSTPDRDPRGRTISVSYLALTPTTRHKIRPSSDAAKAEWFLIQCLPVLAFDHADIVATAKARLVKLVERLDPEILPYLLALLPTRFTLAQLQAAYEAILGQDIDKRNFRRMILTTGALKETGEFERGSHRPAQLFEAS